MMERGVIAMLVVGLAATRASGYAVGPAVALEAMAKTADLVCKATVVSERPVKDAWFEPVTGFEVREAELRVVSIVKGAPGLTKLRFRHYAPKPGPTESYAPQSYQLGIGRTIFVFAARGAAGEYRQLSKRHTQKEDQGVVIAADDRPHRGATITEALWAELRAQLAAPSPDDVIAAIAQLDTLSGGHQTGLSDFDRRAALDAIRPLVASPTPVIASAAIGVFGADSPFFDDRQAPFWLAGIGKGQIPGLSAMTPPASPAAGAAVKELVAVADAGATPELRALAIRALGRSSAIPASKLAAWVRDRAPAIRRAAVQVSSDRAQITAAAADPEAEVRIAAALAIGFTQDAALLPVLGKLLADPGPKVPSAAALSLLSFAPDIAGPILKASLGSSFRSLFVNALARRDPQPYLAILAEVIEQQLQPTDWWGGMIPAGDSWAILFGYIKARPAAELAAGKHDRSLDALERMRWYSSGEPRDLYALYVRRGLTARAQTFRAAMRKANTGLNLDYYFDMADKNPESYVP